MTMKTLFLPLILTTTLAFSCSVQFDLENELIFMFDHATEFDVETKDKMFERVSNWLVSILDKHATGRLKLTKEDEVYLGRIGYMACGIMNARNYGEDDEDI